MTEHRTLARRTAVLALLVVLVPLLTAAANAQQGGPYELTWSTVDGGGAMWSEGGSYVLGGTAGQADAGTLTGGGYELRGGFWAGVGEWVYRVSLPLVIRGER
jgi:hypothetical protein